MDDKYEYGMFPKMVGKCTVIRYGGSPTPAIPEPPPTPPVITPAPLPTQVNSAENMVESSRAMEISQSKKKGRMRTIQSGRATTEAKNGKKRKKSSLRASSVAGNYTPLSVEENMMASNLLGD